MNQYHDDLDAFAAVTEPRGDLAATLPAAHAAMRMRAGAAPSERPRSRALVPTLLAAGLTVLVAAAVPFALRHQPPPTPVDRTFVERGTATLGDAVRVSWQGTGAATGDARAVGLAWEAGTLGVEVDPGRGVGLEVTTGEATIRVVGTGFRVVRDAFGTAVTVRHGVVAVTCAGTEHGPRVELRLGAGEAVTCLPVTPAALLGRARAQMGRGDAPEEVLETVLSARVGASGDVASELGLLHAWLLARLGRPDEALAVADAVLADPGPRRVELLRLATSLAVEVGGCARARTYNGALAALGETAPCPVEPE